jgi:hypothetical protein
MVRVVPKPRLWPNYRFAFVNKKCTGQPSGSLTGMKRINVVADDILRWRRVAEEVLSEGQFSDLMGVVVKLNFHQNKWARIFRRCS